MEDEPSRSNPIGPSSARRVVGREEIWTQLISYARVNFGMSQQEFMRLTPRFFDALMRQHKFNLERHERGRDYMLSQVIAMIANTGFRSFEETRQPREFLPAWQTADTGDVKITPQKQKRRKRSAIANSVRNVMASLMRH